ncbi:MAG: alanine racemase, partial [Desulfovibrio sp.]|nr:alanine racemase [Desulfovibrio sp.]
MSDIRSSYTDNLHFYGRHTPRELAETFGTPLYVYNENVLRQRCRDLMGLSNHPGFGVNYSIKANANPVLLRMVREEGLVVDAMSPGELYMDQLAGFTEEQILYISNNNSREELQNALKHNLLVSVDSLSQLDDLGSINRGGKVMVRFNPGIGAGHHAKVVTAGKETKFGVNPDQMDEVFALLQKHDMTLAGINQHIGSLFMEAEGYLNAAEVLLHLAEQLPEGALKTLEIIDFGGGFGIPYRKYEGQPRLDMAELGSRLHALFSGWAAKTCYTGRFLVEPGRYVAAECSVLLGSVHA